MATIYEMACLETGKRYIGCTKNPMKRFREHRCLLNKRQHSSKQMIKDWHKHGPNSFVMVGLEDVADDVGSRRRAELYWLEKTPKWQLYNPNFQSFAPSPEAIKKGVEAARQPEVLARRSLTMMRRRKPYCKLGHDFTPENTFINKKGSRVCRKCRLISQRAYASRSK